MASGQDSTAVLVEAKEEKEAERRRSTRVFWHTLSSVGGNRPDLGRARRRKKGKRGKKGRRGTASRPRLGVGREKRFIDSRGVRVCRVSADVRVCARRRAGIKRLYAFDKVGMTSAQHIPLGAVPDAVLDHQPAHRLDMGLGDVHAVFHVMEFALPGGGVVVVVVGTNVGVGPRLAKQLLGIVRVAVVKGGDGGMQSRWATSVS